MMGFSAHELAHLALRVGIVLAGSMASAVVVFRLIALWTLRRDGRLEIRYRSLIERAVLGDEAAVRALLASPARDHLGILKMMIRPLIDDRDPERIARTRTIARALNVVPVVQRYMRSRLWWRRSVALRTLGVLQAREWTPTLVAALDDAHDDVRAAALDGLTDMQDPSSVGAIVVRINDASLHRGRRAAALSALGPQAEGFVLDLAAVDAPHRRNYAKALTTCGTARSRAALREWTRDPRADVQAAAFEALATVGLDEPSASLAIAALDHPDPAVRAMAAHALRGWKGDGDAATPLARHLDDQWTVAVQAARALGSLGPPGIAVLRAAAERADLPGLLARQIIWEAGAR